MDCAENCAQLYITEIEQCLLMYKKEMGKSK